MKSYPLSKAAVEAAALELWRFDGGSDDPRAWEQDAESRLYREAASRILSAALAAWEPSKAQVKAVHDVADHTFHGMPSAGRALLAAVRTKADE